MKINFNPQFHKRISHSDGGNAWVATPLPNTLIPAKTVYYRVWQRDESLRLQKAGERVVGLAAGRQSSMEADCARRVRCETGNVRGNVRSCTYR